MVAKKNKEGGWRREDMVEGKRGRVRRKQSCGRKKTKKNVLLIVAGYWPSGTNFGKNNA